jgi:hypothetical protein
MEKDVLDVLKRSGWYPHRKSTSTYCIEVLQKNYEVFKKAIDFITEYNELTFTFNNPKNPNYVTRIIVKPIVASTELDSTVLKSYELHTNLKLLPVAIVYEYSMTICISTLGSFFGGNDDWLIYLGDSFPNVLDNLIHGKNLNAELVELID